MLKNTKVPFVSRWDVKLCWLACDIADLFSFVSKTLSSSLVSCSSVVRTSNGCARGPWFHFRRGLGYFFVLCYLGMSEFPSFSCKVIFCSFLIIFFVTWAFLFTLRLWTLTDRPTDRLSFRAALPHIICSLKSSRFSLTSHLCCLRSIYWNNLPLSTGSNSTLEWQKKKKKKKRIKDMSF